jgi:hypothetical protein
MTALNFRKNMREFMPWAISATKTTARVVTKVATDTATKANTNEKLHDIRCRAAALIMPNDMAFVITPKDNI